MISSNVVAGSRNVLCDLIRGPQLSKHAPASCFELYRSKYCDDDSRRRTPGTAAWPPMPRIGRRTNTPVLAAEHCPSCSYWATYCYCYWPSGLVQTIGNSDSPAKQKLAGLVQSCPACSSNARLFSAALGCSVRAYESGLRFSLMLQLRSKRRDEIGTVRYSGW
jgi:hypothetical protein